MEKPLLKISNISKKYLFNEVLKSININLHPGKFYTLVGENGAGKSTIFKIIVGLEYPNTGTGMLLGEELTAVSAKNKHRIGIVSEQIELDGPLNMFDFFQFYSAFFPKWDQKLFKKIVRHQKLDLSKQFKKYSRGQKMQLVLIAELCKSPDILLIDEITSVLDVYGRQFYLNLFREYIEKKNGTIFLTTNIITEVSPFIDHIFVIRKGQLVFDDQKNNISKEVVRIKKDYDGELPTDHLNLSSYYLIAASEADSIEAQYIDKATTEDLFLFLYRHKSKGNYVKAA